MTPKQATTAFCRGCVDGLNHPERIEQCQGDQAIPEACPLYPYRLGGKRVTVKAIRKFCLQCQGSSPGVQDCPTGDCPLYDFRMGKNPARKGYRNSGSFGRQWHAEPSKGDQFSIIQWLDEQGHWQTQKEPKVTAQHTKGE